MTAPCESCGADLDEAELEAVHRVYLDTDGNGRIVGERVLEEVEPWCISCRSTYPHRPAGA